MEPDLVPYVATSQIPSRSVLVLAPHADDEIFGCGGAIRTHTQCGAAVCVVVLTDGALYGDASLRASESRAAAGLMGYNPPEFWELPDRGVCCTEPLILRVINRIEALNADLVYAPSPWEIHPDHRQTAQLAIEAVIRLGSPVRIIFYEVGAPLRPNVLLDITKVMELKDCAMACFESQLNQQDYRRHIRALNQYRTYTLDKSVAAAEAFLLLSAEELSALIPTGFFDRVSVGLQPMPSGLMSSSEHFTGLPRVSVLVISEGNDALKDALDSIALQTYANIEVIVAARTLEHPILPRRCGRFPLEMLPTGEGISRPVAGNRGLRESHGDFVVIMGAADWLMPGHIARLVSLMRANPAIKAAHTGVRWVGAQSQPLGRDVDSVVDASGLVGGQPLPLCSMMVSKDLLATGCQFNPMCTSEFDSEASFLASVCERYVLVHLPGMTAIHHDQAHQMDSPLKSLESQQPRRWYSRLLNIVR